MRKPLILGLLAGLATLTALTATPGVAKAPGPNGRIAFARFDPVVQDDVTYTANPDGSHMQRLLPGFASGMPHWSPDGTAIAVASSLGIPCCKFPYSAVIVNPDTGRFRTLPMQDPNVTTFCQIWSPDATRLACDGENDSNVSVNGVYTIRSSDGGGLTRITNARGGDDLPIDYSPNGQQLVFAHTAPFHTCDKKSALYVVNVDGTGLHQITPRGFCDDDGSWSPDGAEIAFEHRGSLFVVHPDGTGLAKIPLAVRSRSFAGDFSWSPDGTKISFLLFTQTGARTFQEGIATANANGSDVHQLTGTPTSVNCCDHQSDWGPHPLITP
jgi:Tol biopolymer transport system component